LKEYAGRNAQESKHDPYNQPLSARENPRPSRRGPKNRDIIPGKHFCSPYLTSG
jgi:hypothetical protein